MNIAINNINIIDVINETIFHASVGINNCEIIKISNSPISARLIINGKGKFLSPGFIDAHFHIESSNLTPFHFGEAVLRQGTSTIIADCHEICNVAGMEGFEYFREESKKARIDVFLTAPSCVPASSLGTSGAKIGIKEIRKMFEYKEVIALGEVMNFPAVINDEPEILAKIKIAKEKGKIVNGHAPHLSGDNLKKYINAGITDDHESTSYDEMIEKLSLGMNIFIREGSAEKCPDKCYQLLNEYKDNIMFCSDDKLASDIIKNGHINFNVRKTVSLGINPIRAIRAASFNTAQYYKLDNIGTVEKGKKANLQILNNLIDFIPEIVIFNGNIVYQNGKTIPVETELSIPNNILKTLKAEKISTIPKIPYKYYNHIIEVKDGLIITKELNIHTENEIALDKDILKLVVVERYNKKGNISTCQVHGFNLKKGAIASSIAHDCHNIIAVGTNDEDIKSAVNIIIENQGGLSSSCKGKASIMKLPVAGLMSLNDYHKVAIELDRINVEAQSLGSDLKSPFGSLSFLALEVIPDIKLTDKGLVDVNRFTIL
ncbi:MAG: adenine deaminase [Candidatus Cloacimonadota bacterium]|nr:adenine deaminase [Candidatus Cloacimonadota bacterium]